MFRGLLSGLVWGAILGALGLGFVSLLSPVPPNRAEDVAAVIESGEAQQAPAEATAPEPAPEPAPQPELAQAPEPARQAPAEAAPAEAAPEEGAAAPAGPPDVVAEAPEPEAPPAAQVAADVSVPEPVAAATAERSAAVPGGPAEPGSPEAPPESGLAAPLPPPPEAPEEPSRPATEGAGEEVVAVLLPHGAEAAASPATPDVPAAMAPEAAPAAPAPAPLPQVVELRPEEPAGTAEAEAPAAVEAEPPAAAPVQAEAAPPAEEPARVEPEPLPPAEEAAEPEPEPEAGPAAPEARDATRIAVGQQAGFGELAPDVRVNRLPRIGDGAAAEPMATEEAGEAAEAGALGRYAARFENREAKPLFSLVLLDIGTDAGGLDQAALADFPFPVSFAIPTDRPDAGEAAQAYRAAGFEVVMMAGALPGSATPADLEVSFEAFRAAMPEAVAVLDAPDGGFQGSRSLAAQVVAILGAEGQGLLTYDRGLNSAAQIAEREGVPSARVFRDLDAEPQDTDALRRALDRAALRAVQEGQVIVLARSRPDTVSALFAWALEGRAESVALAPVSAVLMGN